MRPLKLRSILRNSALALALTAIVGGIAAAPASAEEWNRHGSYGRYEHNGGWRGREWRAHEWREHRDYRRHYAYGYGAPRYYAPPAFGFGLNFR